MKVLSIEQMTRLKELGVDVEPNGLGFMYSSVVLDEYRLMYAESVCEDDMKAFNLQDVIELLPKRLMSDFGDADLIIQPNRDATVYVISYEPKNDIIAWFYDENILDAAYKMLIWVIENNYLKTII